ncbi:conserved membrane protein of unknown function [Pararobbsia alpina]|uniref:hypothetical protein n=1 Tax=Pararobbsia alpina TaxID=621374 RepID=UPI0039A6CDDF
MLDSLLTNLQRLISAQFVVSIFFPMLAFWASNGLMCFLLNRVFAEYVTSLLENPKLASSLFVIGCALGLVAIAAYMFSALIPALQSILEGRWPQWLAGFYTPTQARKYESLRDRITEVDRLRAWFETRLSTNRPRWKEWQHALRDFRTVGMRHNTNAFSANSEGFLAVTKLEKAWRKNAWVSKNLLEECFNKMIDDLRFNNADLPNNDGLFLLDSKYNSLWSIIEDTVQFTHLESIRITNQMQFCFGERTFAPTAMGNIANTISAYANQKYNINMETFWPKMQRALQKDVNFGPVLTGSKMQLDFLIACSVLTGIWGMIWVIILIWIATNPIAFCITTITAALMSYGWYRVAVSHYRSFAAIMRTSIDLFRFDLLDDLHFDLPSDTDSERELWNTLHRISVLGESINVPLKHK